MAYEPFNPITIGSPIREEWGSKVQNNLQDHENRLLNIGGAFDYEKVIYIAPNSGGGSDVNGTGTEGNPYETLQKAIDSIQASTVTSNGSFVIQAANGTYTFYKPVKINQFSRIAIRGNLSDHSLVVFDFDLRMFPAVLPQDLKERSACFQVSASRIEFDGFMTEITYDSTEAPGTYENFTIQRSDAVFGNIDITNEFHGGINLIQASSFGVVKYKTLSGTVSSGLTFSDSSHGGSTDNGHINLAAFSPGSGIGVISDVSSRFTGDAFQSADFTDFSVGVSEGDNSGSTSLYLAPYVAGGYTFAMHSVDSSFPYLKININHIHGDRGSDKYNSTAVGVWFVRTSDLAIRGAYAGQVNSGTIDLYSVTNDVYLTHSWDVNNGNGIYIKATFDYSAKTISFYIYGSWNPTALVEITPVNIG